VKLSIIIVNWNTGALLGRCLEAVCATLPTKQAELIVVDNASSDGSLMGFEQRFPHLRLMSNQRNLGFSRANNQGIRQSTGAHVLLLNPDTQVLPGALAQMMDALERDPQVGAVGPRLLNRDGSLQPSCFPAPTLARELWRLFHLDAIWPRATYPMQGWDPTVSRDVDVIQGACVLVRREALDQVGLLDEEYFIYSEDYTLCQRLRDAGWRLQWVPRAGVIHVGGQSTQLAPTEMFLNLYRAKVLYFRKHANRATARVYKLILAAAAAARLFLAPLAWIERSPTRSRHLTLARRYWSLLTALPGM
jgi:N-acetylglucosaminyl-diphospho-decaprenol L-rhamnosyltransferase